MAKKRLTKAQQEQLREAVQADVDATEEGLWRLRFQRQELDQEYRQQRQQLDGQISQYEQMIAERRGILDPDSDE